MQQNKGMPNQLASLLPCAAEKPQDQNGHWINTSAEDMGEPGNSSTKASSTFDFLPKSSDPVERALAFAKHNEVIASSSRRPAKEKNKKNKKKEKRKRIRIIGGLNTCKR